jgi:hypothetical protein
MFLPAGNDLVDRLDPRLRPLAGGKIIDVAAVEPIADADLDVGQAVDDVESVKPPAAEAARSPAITPRFGHSARRRPAG